MISSVVFNGTDLTSFGVRFSGTKTYGAPERAVSFESVPGRNGDIVIDEGAYRNTDITYTAMIHEDFKDNIKALRNYLLSVKGYARLEDSYSPDTYYMACYSNAIELTAQGPNNKWAEFDITFNRKPQRFLLSGEEEEEFTSSDSIANPTLFNSKPLIRIYGTGTVGIGSVNITFDGSTSYVDIDCELQDAYYGSVNKNSSIVLSPNKYPELLPGTNGISLGTGITQVNIIPRWWHL